MPEKRRLIDYPAVRVGPYVFLFVVTVPQVWGSRYAALLIALMAIVCGAGIYVNLNAGKRNRPH